MSNESNRREGIIAWMRHKGRTVIGWWDNEPIHRPMTPDELLANAGIDEKTADLALTLLSSKDYKPTF